MASSLESCVDIKSYEQDTNPAIYGYEDSSKNLLKNWNFEEPISDDNWRVAKAQYTRSEEAHTGNWSLHIHNRAHKHGNVFQRVYNIKPNTSYYHSVFIKFLNQPPNRMFFLARTFVFVKQHGQDTRKRLNVAMSSFMRVPCDWIQLGGDFRTPDTPFDYLETHVEIQELGVEYLLDTASLIELEADPDWRKTSDLLIDQHRKNNLSLNIKLPRRLNLDDIEIKIKQIKRDFGFGAAISADVFNSKDYRGQKYRECFFDNFEWAVFCNDTKWKCMERRKDKIRYDRVDTALKTLHQRGITVRAHTIHWNGEPHCPDWVHGKKGEELQQEIERRTHYVVDHFKGKFVHWDVCNEHLHCRFFEEATNNPDILKQMFRQAHSIDDQCKLFLNDYLVIRTGDMTSAQANLARMLLAKNAPVHGIGVQSHLRHVPIQIENIRKRLEIVCAVGLPVVVSELSVHTMDVHQRAVTLEEILRVYFSQPAVAGVLFWHFSDQPGVTMGEDMPLFEGPEYEPNEAGQVFQSLLKQWRTNLTLKPSQHRIRESYRVFHGQYEIEVLQQGKPIWGQSFQVNKGQDLELNLKIKLHEKSPQGSDSDSDNPSCPNKNKCVTEATM